MFGLSRKNLIYLELCEFSGHVRAETLAKLGRQSECRCRGAYEDSAFFGGGKECLRYDHGSFHVDLYTFSNCRGKERSLEEVYLEALPPVIHIGGGPWTWCWKVSSIVDEDIPSASYLASDLLHLLGFRDIGREFHYS